MKIFVRLLMIVLLVSSQSVWSKGGATARVSVSAARAATSVVAKTAKINVSAAKAASGKSGVSGAKAQKLFESFKQTHKPKPTLNKADLDSMFKPDYRKSVRQEYYRDYVPQQSAGYQKIVVEHQSNYGFWDGMMFNAMLDNMGDREMYYQHRREPEFQAWRTDADKACADGDKDVCEKLADLDREMREYEAKKVPLKPNYVTPGIDATVYLKDSIDTSKYPAIRVCTGSITSDYSRYTDQLAKITKLKVVPITTNGSIDNAAKLASGECDFAYVQDDISNQVLSKIFTVDQREVGFLACHKKANIKSVSDIKDQTIFIGSDQTGSQYTFDNLGIKAVTNRQDSVMSFLSNQYQNEKACLFAVSTPQFPAFKQLDTVNNFVLVPIQGVNGYKTAILSSDHYKNLTDDRFIGTFKNANGWFAPNGTPTIVVNTSLVTTKTWLDANAQLSEIIMLNREELQSALR